MTELIKLLEKRHLELNRLLRFSEENFTDLEIRQIIQELTGLGTLLYNVRHGTADKLDVQDYLIYLSNVKKK